MGCLYAGGRQLLNLLRREIINRQQLETRGYTTSRYAETGPAGGITLTGESFDALVNLYADRHELGGYALKEGIPSLTMQVERRRGGVQIRVQPSLGSIKGLDLTTSTARIPSGGWIVRPLPGCCLRSEG